MPKTAYACFNPACATTPPAEWCTPESELISGSYCGQTEANCTGCNGIWAPKPGPSPPSGGGQGKPDPRPMPQTPFPPIKQDWNGVQASTTEFAFGSSTACVCNGQKVTKDLLPLGWVGLATPDWMLTPFETTHTNPANGADTPTELLGSNYVSNCGVGAGGCHTCWELTSTKTPNVYKQDPPDKTYTMRGVVVDTCEDRNAYGNNTNWCMAAAGVPKGGIDIRPNGYNDLPKEIKDKVKPGFFEFRDGQSHWYHPDCVDSDGNWTCTNLAGQKAHFDIASHDPLFESDEARAKINMWPQRDANPIVTAKPIPCPQEVTNILKKNCGANAAGPQEQDSKWAHCMWCPADNKANQNDPGALPAKLPDWWGGCGKEDQHPECAYPYGQCGGNDYKGPTCCQWPEFFQCQADNEYYSGCKPKKEKAVPTHAKK
jgi:hypothetical protein